MIRVLAIGDIVGSSGHSTVVELVPRLREELNLDLVIANGENAARGMGISARLADALLAAGIDGITLGNHALRDRDVLPMLATSDRIVRPANLPRRAPGRGVMYLPVTTSDGATVEVAVANLIGSLYLGDAGVGAFDVAEEIVDAARGRTPIVLVDMHAEATSEKVAMGLLLDGRASAVWGTHTHVQTSDARILPGGTAYITDLGMSGPHTRTVIGVRAEIVLKKLTTGIGARFEPGTDGCQLEGAVVDIDERTGRATSIEAIRIPGW